ncbi:tripartite tricarboxylate transporter substrate binding protein [Bacillus tequilensis]|uniref:Tripartite tricarboxylate transporter substrate binding protein n=1 Tax=Bacillus tequilensis TaxID=227866 RepID=A0A6H0WK26_9BACI|nr:tripartite tricarboxylate transporter substrate binding protein [Bacillus tequilensis]QIW79025.1 tripartite tricarboxylate transporter substrate binding protein [Bacillus tequilensis]
MNRSILLFIALLLFMQGDIRQAAAPRLPDGPIEIVVPAEPSGGWDVTAQAIQSVLRQKQIVKGDVHIVYKPGGGGEKGWKYVNDSSKRIISMTSSLILSNDILRQSKLKMSDFTPLAILSKEWQAVALPKGSSLTNGKDLLDEIKMNPGKVKIGFAPGFGNDDQLSFVSAADMYGIDPFTIQFLQYDSSEQLIQALIRHEIEAASMTVSEAKTYERRGDLTLAAVTSDKRLPGFPDVPTWKEQGIPFVFSHWRGVLGPKNMSEEEISYWDQALKKVTSSPEWKRKINDQDGESFYLNSRETKRFLEQQTTFYQSIMTGN